MLTVPSDGLYWVSLYTETWMNNNSINAVNSLCAIFKNNTIYGQMTSNVHQHNIGIYLNLLGGDLVELRCASNTGGGYGNWTYIQFFTVTLATDLANIPTDERRLEASVSSKSELFDGFDPTVYILNELIPTSKGPIILAHSSEDLMHSISEGDASSFDIRSENGALTFIAPAPDYETQNSYSATISATDGIDIVTRDVNYIIEDDPSDSVVLNFDSDS